MNISQYLAIKILNLKLLMLCFVDAGRVLIDSLQRDEN